MRYLAQSAAPLDNNPIDIPCPKQIGNPFVLGCRIFVDAGDDLIRARTVFWRNAVFEIARNGLQTKRRLADHRQPSCPPIVFAAEAETGVKICQVIDQFIEVICFILERRGERETVSLLEEAHNPAAKRGFSFRVDLMMAPPQLGRSR